MIGATVVNPPLEIELAAVVVGALAGATYAVKRELDVTGVLAIAIATGLGGGILRDILLNTVPLSLQDPVYLVTAAIAAVVGVVLGNLLRLFNWLILLVDAVSLGLFTIVGAERTLLRDLPVSSAIVVGVITGVGGGILRDTLVGNLPPEALRRGAPYATVALVGAAAYVLWEEHSQVSRVTIEIVVVIAMVILRLAGLAWGLRTPGADVVTPRVFRDEDPHDDDES